jgi:hypothetical protein
LSNEHLPIEGDLFPGNLRNKPLFVVNGGQDPLYPIAEVEPYLQHLANGHVAITYKPQPQAGHDTSWWPSVKDPYESFVRDHARDPYQDRVTWETTDTRLSGRAHWLVIDSLAGRGGNSDGMDDLNDFTPPPRADIGFRLGSGLRIDVSEFTLLLSPDRFDFTQPVKVIVNGRVVRDARVEKSLAALMKWAARDNDRTMLFAAEIKVKP